MGPSDYIAAARVPESLSPQTFGLWTIQRVHFSPSLQLRDQLIWKISVGFDSQTLLRRWSWKSLNQQYGEVVMEDSRKELRSHLPIWLNAKGKVLITGLGLGCVVRGLLASQEVEHITVIEIDKQILRIVGHEFQANKRVTMIQADALKVKLADKFDYAWHDIWTDGDHHLSVLHADLLRKFRSQCRFQGAWNMPRWVKRNMPTWFLR